MIFLTDRIVPYLEEIRNNKLNHYDPVNGDLDMGIAMLEYDWIDIEVNIDAGWDEKTGLYTERPYLSYFCCIKGFINGGTEWDSYGYLDEDGYDVEVDFNADNWRELLKADMELKLAQYAKKHGLKYDGPNFNER